MNRVCYILGAGFSRPFGFPLMNDFAIMAKRIPLGERTRAVEALINIEKSLDRLMIHTNFQPSNIENLLSFEHTRNLLNETHSTHIRDGIIDVIKHYESKVKFNFDRENVQPNWFHGFFANGPETPQSTNVARWLAAMSGGTVMKSRVKEVDFVRLQYDRDKANKNRFGIITLNYDCILDRLGEELFAMSSEKSGSGTRSLGTFTEPESGRIAYYKLHGSSDYPDSIIPPTWQKGAGFGKDLWKQAYNHLKECTEIRIIGYSLPESDSYMKYFLDASIAEIENLERIDVIDPSDDVGKRFKAHYKNCRFMRAKSEDYFESISRGVLNGAKGNWGGTITLGDVDFWHNNFMLR